MFAPVCGRSLYSQIHSTDSYNSFDKADNAYNNFSEENSGGVFEAELVSDYASRSLPRVSPRSCIGAFGDGASNGISSAD